MQANAQTYLQAFLHAEPFRHAVIDNFFEQGFAERLLDDFPAFNPALAKNEIYGGVWGKAVNTRIREIAPAYRELYELIQSRPFLDFMGEITGIPGLLFDPALYGEQLFDAYLYLASLEKNDQEKSRNDLGRAQMIADKTPDTTTRSQMYQRIADGYQSMGLLKDAIRIAARCPLAEYRDDEFLSLIRKEATTGRINTAKQMIHLVRKPEQQTRAWQDIAEIEADAAEKKTEEEKKLAKK